MIDFERSGNNPSDFEIEDQSTLDLILLAEVATDFGEVQVASNLVCNAISISQAELDAQKHADSIIKIRQRGGLWSRPDLLPLSEEECRERLLAEARVTAAKYSADAAEKITNLLKGLEDDWVREHVVALLSLLGVNLENSEPFPADYDPVRAQKIIQTAKLMDTAYCDFVLANPSYMRERDPHSLSELSGREISNPVARQAFKDFKNGH